MTYTIDREALVSHIDGVRRLARTLVIDESTAEDVVQDTMLVALQSRSERRAGARAWIAGVTRNIVRRGARTAVRRRRREEAVARPEALPATDDVVIRAAEQSRLLDAVVGLSEPYRTAVLLRFVEDLPPRDIAARLGIPVETARTQVKRGLERLRRRLDDAHGGDRGRWLAALLLAAGGSPPVAAVPPRPPLPTVAAVIAVLLVLSAGVWTVLARRESSRARPSERERSAAARSVVVAKEGSPRTRAADAPPARTPTPTPTVSDPDDPESSPWSGSSAGEATDPSLPTAQGDGTFEYADNGYVQLDPAHADPTRPNDERLILALFEGLTIRDPRTGRVLPGAAREWTCAADRRTWTFRLREDAVWSDGSRLTAADFLRSWRRSLDPFTRGEGASLFRVLAGCRTIVEDGLRAETYSRVRDGLRTLRPSRAIAVSSDDVVSLLDDLGARPLLTALGEPAVRRLLDVSAEDTVPAALVDQVIDVVGKARRACKTSWEDAFEAFGGPGSGAEARDPLTLILRTEGQAPFLPALLARSAFVPLHATALERREQAFVPEGMVVNGPYVLEGRGPRPPDDEPTRRISSVVELRRNPAYRGVHSARYETVRCVTDLALQIGAADDLDLLEDVRRFRTARLDRVYCTWPEYPRIDDRPKQADGLPVDLRAALAALPGWTVWDAPRVTCLCFRCDRTPFESREARRALALAVDRAGLAGAPWPAAAPADRLVPPGTVGRIDGPGLAPRDGEAARRAWRRAGLSGDTWVELSFDESPGAPELVRRLCQGWKDTLGLDPGRRIEVTCELPAVIRGGRYQVLLATVCGAVDDPLAFLATFDARDPASGLGCRDATFEALLDAARDPQAALGSSKTWLAAGSSDLKGALEEARLDPGRLGRLRGLLLRAAEQRLLDECIVVPLLLERDAALVRSSGRPADAAQALGSPRREVSFRR